MRARELAERLNCQIAIVDKRRPQPNVAEVMNIIGSVDGKTAVIIDDLIDTGGTIVKASEALIKQELRKCMPAVLTQYSQGMPRKSCRQARSRK